MAEDVPDTYGSPHSRKSDYEFNRHDKFPWSAWREQLNRTPPVQQEPAADRSQKPAWYLVAATGGSKILAIEAGSRTACPPHWKLLFWDGQHLQRQKVRDGDRNLGKPGFHAVPAGGTAAEPSRRTSHCRAGLRRHAGRRGRAVAARLRCKSRESASPAQHRADFMVTVTSPPHVRCRLEQCGQQAPGAQAHTISPNASARRAHWTTGVSEGHNPEN